ncbi:MAG: hemerythrin domain-containing protein [Candidatus Acidiferrales bacterium]
MKIDVSTTIKDIVAEVPNAIAILRNFGISLDREEDRALGLACQSAGVPVEDVVCSLDQGGLPQPETDTARWDDALPSSLIAHIVEKHHAYCRGELGRLEQLLRTVVHTHGDRHPELRRIQTVFIKMATDLKQHLLKEEQTLFPMIVRMEEAHRRQTAPPRFPFGTIANPIRMMILEHDTGDHELDEIRKLSSNYILPAEAGADYQALIEGLQGFEQDMKQHVFLENDRLFPRAIALEQEGTTGRSAQP